MQTLRGDACGDRGATVPFLACALRAGLVRCHLRHVYGLRTYDFSNLYNFPLNKIVEATEPVNPYENLTAASCLRTEASCRIQAPYGGLTEAARKGGYGQDTGSVDPSQAKCELGISGTEKVYCLRGLYRRRQEARINLENPIQKHSAVLFVPSAYPKAIGSGIHTYIHVRFTHYVITLASVSQYLMWT